MNLQSIRTMQRKPKLIAKKEMRISTKREELLITRRDKILLILKAKIEVRLKDLAVMMKCVEKTIRNDIDALCDDGIVKKQYRGSKGLFLSVVNA